MKDIKYFLAYTIPVSCLIALKQQGLFSFLTVVYAFGFIPLLELIFSSSESSYSEEDKSSRLKNVLFDCMLYLNLPILFGILVYGLIVLTTQDLARYEWVGLVFSIGIVAGTNGINVAHELGHRQTKTEQFLAKLLLLPSLYMHFFIEHNLGHHRNIGTPEDPATARKDQSVYHFWLTSIIGQIRSAHQIQKRLLEKNGKGFWSLDNELLFFFCVEVGYLVLLYVLLGVQGLIFGVLIALVAVLLLETINYIEHYGLVRRKVNDRYERVTPAHSWNSNHVIGRMVLYELTRHSDHHHRASKKYQILESIESSPQLPFGYTTCMVLSLITPLWFRIMNSRISY
jgi:alkane 1-monooxygenase